MVLSKIKSYFILLVIVRWEGVHSAPFGTADSWCVRASAFQHPQQRRGYRFRSAPAQYSFCIPITPISPSGLSKRPRHTSWIPAMQRTSAAGPMQLSLRMARWMVLSLKPMWWRRLSKAVLTPENQRPVLLQKHRSQGNWPADRRGRYHVPYFLPFIFTSIQFSSSAVSLCIPPYNIPLAIDNQFPYGSMESHPSCHHCCH